MMMVTTFLGPVILTVIMTVTVVKMIPIKILMMITIPLQILWKPLVEVQPPMKTVSLLMLSSIKIQTVLAML